MFWMFPLGDVGIDICEGCLFFIIAEGSALFMSPVYPVLLCTSVLLYLHLKNYYFLSHIPFPNTKITPSLSPMLLPL